jgi:hypothetical protein
MSRETPSFEKLFENYCYICLVLYFPIDFLLSKFSLHNPWIEITSPKLVSIICCVTLAVMCRRIFTNYKY